uniref:Uncharacterized protein n=1 Tax=uncultured prokaryote TaxID=198431 RepID=A0A0H5Q7W6_9ZZZZ|nr:hypothetical protein [uncultured prokaryote]
MELEQLEFGNVAVDVVNVACSYQWGSRWTVKVMWRHSGQEGFLQQTRSGLDEAEAHAIVVDALAGLLGLV